MSQSVIKNTEAVTDYSSYFSSTVYSQMNYAVRFGKMVFFSFFTNNITISANSEYVVSLITNSVAKPKSVTSVCVAPGSSNQPTDIQAFIRNNGELVLRTASGITSKAYVISGCYLLS